MILMIVLKNIKKMSKITTAEECFNNFVDFEIFPFIAFQLCVLF